MRAHAHFSYLRTFSLINFTGIFFLNVTIFPRENVIYRSRPSGERFIFVSRDKSAGQRVKILFKQLSRIYLSRTTAKRIRECCDSGTEWPADHPALFTSRLNVTTGNHRYRHEKTGSPLDLIGFDISYRWGSSRRRLAINLYPVTRRS